MAALLPPSKATTLWYVEPGAESAIMEQGLPIGNGRIGALVTADPALDALYLADASLWTGGFNDTLLADGQYPYEEPGMAFGSVQLLAKAHIKVPTHARAAAGDYRRLLDLSNGCVSASYRLGGVTYRREVYASHPDDVIVVHLSQSGGGRYTGSVALTGTHGETATAAVSTASCAGTFANGLAYGAIVQVASGDGVVSVSAQEVTFAGCRDVLIVIGGGTNYANTPASGFKDPTVDPLALARAKVAAAIRRGATALLTTHVADYQELYNAMTLHLGTSTAEQRAMDTPTRLAARAVNGAAPDPEFEASYLQFGRYLMIAGSRRGLPLNLQGLWQDRNDPDWMSDYHTDINVQMNYWLPDRAGLSTCFEALADYCLSQLSSWTDSTARLFNDPRNRFRNSTGKVAGWTTAISTNIWGGGGWWWHPAGNAWLCNSLFEHYEYTRDRAYVNRIYPLLKGACQFWEARLITTTVTDPATGPPKQVLIDDSDWSAEHGPTTAKGITYAQELVWQLFTNFRDAAAVLGVDAAYASTIVNLRDRLYLPIVSPKTGWLEEWMTPDNLGDATHRHLSPLVGLFPGDRITADTAPAELLEGVRSLLTARGMSSYGWAMAWRALCWARLKRADLAYQAVLTVMKPSVNFSSGTAINFFDRYSFGKRSIFQIDANFGAPSAMIEMLLYSRPGLIELLPAAPDGWTAAGRATGIGARGGFVVDFSWRNGAITAATIRSVGGTSTTLRCGAWSQAITLAPGRSITVAPRV